MTTTSVSAPEKRRPHPLRQQIAKAARWLHIYLSMVSFAIVLFFAVTGLTLNHPDWFANQVKTRLSQGPIDPALLGASPTAQPNTTALIQSLRTREHLHGAVAAEDLRIDPDEISFSYKAPGYSADVSIDRPHATYQLTETRNGFVAVLNDLHKGRDSGRAWGWVIDISAVLLTLVSLTGLLILWFIYKRRASGLILAALGAALSLLAWKLLVP